MLSEKDLEIEKLQLELSQTLQQLEDLKLLETQQDEDKQNLRDYKVENECMKDILKGNAQFKDLMNSVKDISTILIN